MAATSASPKDSSSADTCVQIIITALNPKEHECPPIRTFTLKEGTLIRIGRASKHDDRPRPTPENGLFFNPVISRHHAEFSYYEKNVRLCDLSSYHGTHVNGVRLVPHLQTIVRTGDIITFAPMKGDLADTMKAYTFTLNISNLAPQTQEDQTRNTAGTYQAPVCLSDDEDSEVEDIPTMATGRVIEALERVRAEVSQALGVTDLEDLESLFSSDDGGDDTFAENNDEDNGSLEANKETEEELGEVNEMDLTDLTDLTEGYYVRNTTEAEVSANPTMMDFAPLPTASSCAANYRIHAESTIPLLAFGSDNNSQFYRDGAPESSQSVSTRTDAKNVISISSLLASHEVPGRLLFSSRPHPLDTDSSRIAHGDPFTTLRKNLDNVQVERFSNPIVSSEMNVPDPVIPVDFDLDSNEEIDDHIDGLLYVDADEFEGYDDNEEDEEHCDIPGEHSDSKSVDDEFDYGEEEECDEEEYGDDVSDFITDGEEEELDEIFADQAAYHSLLETSHEDEVLESAPSQPTQDALFSDTYRLMLLPQLSAVDGSKSKKRAFDEISGGDDLEQPSVKHTATEITGVLGSDETVPELGGSPARSILGGSCLVERAVTPVDESGADAAPEIMSVSESGVASGYETELRSLDDPRMALPTETQKDIIWATSLIHKEESDNNSKITKTLVEAPEERPRKRLRTMAGFMTGGMTVGAAILAVMIYTAPDLAI